MEPFLFWIFSAGMLIFGLSVVLNRNPVASALCLVVTMIFMAALFVLLNAFFLAAVQVLVYAGAVMVLFLFIIMLLDLKAEARRRFHLFSIGIGAAAAFFFCCELFHFLGRTIPPRPDGTVSDGNDVNGVGTLLFQKYLLPFEATGVLLLVATIGVVLLSRKEKA